MQLQVFNKPFFDGFAAMGAQIYMLRTNPIKNLLICGISMGNRDGGYELVIGARAID